MTEFFLLHDLFSGNGLTRAIFLKKYPDILEMYYFIKMSKNAYSSILFFYKLAVLGGFNNNLEQNYKCVFVLEISD